MALKYILNFHRLVPKSPPRDDIYSVDVHMFAEMLDAVRGSSCVEITFDDSYASDYDLAMPLLVNRGMKAFFFVVANRIDEMGFLGRSALRRMTEEGMTVGTHGLNHVRWTQLAPSELKIEIAESRAKISDIAGAPVTQAACPFGEYNRGVLSCLKSLGIERALTSDGGFTQSGHWLQSRNTVTQLQSVESIALAIKKGPTIAGAATAAIRSLAKRLRG
jgi:peptidoglycan/xylan/chitin deacetylase (PgdA/CDA1 family)